MTGAILSALIQLALVTTPPPDPTAVRDWCGSARTTGYLRTEFSGHTYDGTPIWTDEAIAAASWDIPIDSRVEVEDIGTFRIADRGRFPVNGTSWIDIAVWTRAEAYALTGVRRICVYQPRVTQ